MKQRLIVLWLMAEVVLSVGASLIPDMKFRHLDTRDGLSNSQVNCLLRDSRGYLWVGTPYGLNRYDGYRFRTFYYNDKDTTSLRNNYIDEIYEAYDGRLWLKQGMNYSIYDPVTESFIRNVAPELLKMGIEGGVERMFIDSKKNFWVKTYDDGLYYYNPYSKKLNRLRFGYGPKEFSKEYAMCGFSEFRQSVVFVSNYGELVCIDGEKGRISWKSNYVRRRLDTYGDYGVYIDPQTNIYVLSHSKNTSIYVRSEKKWYSSLTQLMRKRGMTDVPDEIMVWDITIDSKGLMWVATDHLGILVIDWKNGQWRQFTQAKEDNTSLSDITVKHLHRDKLGRMWVGCYKNGVNMNSESLTVIQSLEIGDINTICEDTAGNYWLGRNEGGLLRYNPKTGEQQTFTAENAGLTSNVLVGSHASKNGTLWFGTFEGGLIRYEGGRFSVITASTPGSELANNNVWSICEDRWGNIWVGVLGGGVMRIDKQTGRMRSFRTDNSTLRNDWTASIACAPSGLIVLGTSDYYSVINPQNFKIRNDSIPNTASGSAISRTTTQVIVDSRGLLWQGSPSGVAVYDMKAKQVTLLDMNSGLLGSSVSSLAEDKQGYLWVVTDHGVSRIAVSSQEGNSESEVSKEEREGGAWTFTVRSYSGTDGLQNGPFNKRAIYITHDGLVLIGGVEGLDILNPRRLVGNRQRVEPRFSGLVLSDEEVVVGKKYGGRVILKEALDECRKLKLRYSQNNFTIHLASNNGEAHCQARFVYKLEGYNERWVKTSSLNPNISYMSLHHGNYTLCVRMLNDDGTIGDVESRLEISITPPLWRTRWAMLLYILGVLVVAWLWRRRFLKKQAERMELEQLRREVEKQQWMNRIKREAGETIPEAELPELKLERSDLVFMVKRTCSLYKSPYDKQVKVSFVSQLDKLDMDLDRKLVTRMLNILLNNSARFSPDNSQVTVSVDRPEFEQAEIRIADHGVGIPEDSREGMFDATHDSNSGLDLHTVKRIAEEHGGDVRAEDNIGGGTVFIITLPIRTKVPEEPEVEDAVVME